MKRLIARLSILATSLATFAIAESTAEEVRETFIGSGVTRMVGGYRPMPAEMDKQPDIVKVAPEDLVSPKYGEFKFGDSTWAFILDEQEEGDDKLYIDKNGDGDLTNDPAAKWSSRKTGKYKQYSGEGELDLSADRTGTIRFYRFDPSDERRARLKNTILFFSDFGFEYKFDLDGKEFKTFVGGTPSERTRLPIDRNGDGRHSANLEYVSVGKPFNYTGSTYVFQLADGSLTLEASDEQLDMMPLPPDLTVGKDALEFTAKTMDGDEINFPQDYAGKIVMLDFWATWCGPCIGEIPNMKSAYEKWHDKGFEILGISFDQANKEKNIREFLEKKEMPWPQIYEGKGWGTTLGVQHDVSGIPFVLLVDGDTGKILATARQLRGPKLPDVIGEKLQEKNGDDDASDEGDDADA